MGKTKIYNLVVLDASRSMEFVKQEAINGFNETIMTILSAQNKFPEQEHLVSLVSFNLRAIKTVLDMGPVSDIGKLTSENYMTHSGSPLYDAMGISLSRLRSQINQDEEHQVLVTIITDGEENSSREYSGRMIKNLIEELKDQGWAFTFIGANIDAEEVATGISINNYYQFNQNPLGTQAMFIKDSSFRMRYYEKMARGESKKNLSENYFEENEPA